VEYLTKFGYSGAQAYLLLGAAPIEGRVSGVVDIPNACCSLYLPTAIFDFDIRPSPPVRSPPTAGAAPSRPDPVENEVVVIESPC
jgi:formamidase